MTDSLEQAPTPHPGRSCPLHYRYAPEVFREQAPPRLQSLEVLYVVGGLYGNEPALQAVLDLFARESGRKRLVFNGDFHWFDTDPARFSRVQAAVLEHEALRGNVETELADGPGGDDAGCGCAYPDWVGDEVVERSNRILARLRRTVAPRQQAELSALPMWGRADVGELRLGIVHGDATSLSGWGFSQEHLRDPGHRKTVSGWLERAAVDAFACTHTCLPVFQEVRVPAAEPPRWILNNGAAGMPNFSGDTAGLLTRVAVTPYRGPGRRFGFVAPRGNIHVDAIGIEFSTDAWLAQFCRDWPPGSDAHDSYFTRLARGPDYHPAEALRVDAGVRSPLSRGRAGIQRT